jgi:AraC-like DNA-binding protein
VQIQDPPHKKTRATACNSDATGVFNGILPPQRLIEEAGKHHWLVVMPEEKSEARVEWRDEKGEGSGDFAMHGQNVVFIHKDVSYVLIWKQEAALLRFHADDLLLWQGTEARPLGKVEHGSLWQLARHGRGIMEMTRLLIETNQRSKPVFPDAYFRHLGKALCVHLIDALIRENQRKLSPTTMDGDRLHRVLAYIDKNLHGRIPVETLAGVACLSVTHFKRLFKASTGMAARDYVFKERIYKAQALLRQGGANVAEVASRCGFCDQGYMDRCFRRFCRCSPRDFLPKGRIVRKNGPRVQDAPGKTGHNGGTL